MDEEQIEVQPSLPMGIGEQLRAAREGRRLSLEQVAAATRLPQRHLVTMEAGDFASLPGRTYAVGFAKTYAKAVGLDPEYVADEVRAALNVQDLDPRHRPASFEPGDPARVPSRALWWLSIVAVILVLAGLFAFFRPYFSPAAELPSLLEQQRQADEAAAQARQRAAAAAPVPEGGAVMFTALDDGVWVRFYDGAGNRLLEKTLAKGETYTVPAEAQNPQLRTGRPEALAITVGDRAVPKLAEVQKTMKDVPVTAAALLARGTPPPASAPATVEPRPVASRAAASQAPVPRAVPTARASAAPPPAAAAPAPAASPTT